MYGFKLEKTSKHQLAILTPPSILYTYKENNVDRKWYKMYYIVQ
jgi:hypothetical protein